MKQRPTCGCGSSTMNLLLSMPNSQGTLLCIVLIVVVLLNVLKPSRHATESDGDCEQDDDDDDGILSQFMLASNSDAVCCLYTQH